MKKEVKVIIGILGLVIAAFVAATLIYQGQNKTEESLEEANPAIAEYLVREDSPSLGPVDASVTVVEYLDPECESCSAFHPYMKDILKEFEGKIRYVVRYMPYHGNSHLAARANEAAGLQDKYWEMQDLLFIRQGEWGHQHEPQTERFVQYASELGLDTEKFKADMESQALMDKIDRDEQDGNLIGVRGTPSFYVNGEPLEVLDPNFLRQTIEEKL